MLHVFAIPRGRATFQGHTAVPIGCEIFKGTQHNSGHSDFTSVLFGRLPCKLCRSKSHRKDDTSLLHASWPDSSRCAVPPPPKLPSRLSIRVAGEYPPVLLWFPVPRRRRPIESVLKIDCERSRLNQEAASVGVQARTVKHASWQYRRLETKVSGVKHDAALPHHVSVLDCAGAIVCT